MSQLLSCYNYWCLSGNSSRVSDVIFLDLSKAFDSVSHERLLLKLNKYGIDGQLYLWFRNFLTNRRQRVQIRGSYSQWSPVISDVLQGSILGPIMFLIYVNDIPNITSTAKLFADDTKIYRQINKVLAFLILSPPLQNFHVILPTKKCLFWFLPLALDLCRPFSR